MSQGLMAYLAAVPFDWDLIHDTLRKCVGERELKKIQRRRKSPIRWQDAANHLRLGRDFDPALGGFYWELVERHLGAFKNRRLPNGPFMPCPLERFRDVDVELARQAVPLRLEQLVLGGSPIPRIPSPRDGDPLVSWWSPDTLRATGETLARAEAPSDPWMAEAFSTLRGWLDEVSRSGFVARYQPCVVGFYY